MHNIFLQLYLYPPSKEKMCDIRIFIFMYTYSLQKLIILIWYLSK
jgi:hypothetical protein